MAKNTRKQLEEKLKVVNEGNKEDLQKMIKDFNKN